MTRLGMLVLVLALLTGPLQAQSLPPNAAAPLGDPAAFDDPAALEPVLDSLFAHLMERYHVPGAVVAVVAGGQVTALRGYGHTDAESRTPVDPERTIFDLGSVGKLMTATAVMQLVEEGALDLDEDVNQRLHEVRVPSTFDAPVTLRHLLSHTAGFDERLFLGMVAPDPDRIEPLGSNLARHLPPRIYPPGRVFQYSNAGSTLAGYLVEIATGLEFAEYVERRIFEPLGMTGSTYRFVSDVPGLLAVGHENLPGPAVSQERWHLNQRPAGGLGSTALDMAAFMLAHLGEGTPGSAGILGDQSREEMQRTVFTPRPGVPGIALGFMEDRRAGRRGLYHGGQWVGFSSFVYLLPDEGVGIFAAWNQGAAIYAQHEVVETLLDRWFPDDASAALTARSADVPPGADAANAEGAGTLEGTYRWNRRDRHTFFRLPSFLMAHTLRVYVDGPDALVTSMSPPLVPDARWLRSRDDPLIFIEENGWRTLAFDPVERGRSPSVHLSWPLLMTLDWSGPFGTPGIQLGFLAILLGVMASFGVWPLTALFLRFTGRHGSVEGSDPALRRARWRAGWAASSFLAFFPILVIFVAADTVHALQVPVGLRVILVLPVAGSILTVFALAALPGAWRAGAAGRGPLLHLAAVTASLALMVPVLFHWRLLGFHF
jgi:CubicO group peptidase (beta-lactamase class C family)